MAEEKDQQSITRTELEELLNAQTVTILSAVDETLQRSEARVNEKIERLITTLDQFLKRMTDMEDEFTFMKNGLNRVKKVIKDKLGVDLT
jgi:flagellar motility protein MotE (MotC chaperone)